MPVTITPERADSPDARALIDELEAYLIPLSPAESRHGYSVEKLIAQAVDFFLIREDGAPAGCGGVQLYGADYGEIKRMYVRPAFRGRGLGKLMLDHLADHVRSRGIGRLRLETGIAQTDAIALYERAGFRRIPPFGTYRDDPLSRFYEKRLHALAVLETARLLLEPLERSHAAEMFSLVEDERLYRFIPQDPPVSMEALATRYGKLETGRSPAGDQDWLNWIMRAKDSRLCMGRVEVTNDRDGKAAFAYELGASFWGQGYATEACGRVLECLFAEWGVHRVTAEIDTRNTASIRLVERLGFGRESLKVGADVFKGSSSDEYTYALTRDAWQGRKAP